MNFKRLSVDDILKEERRAIAESNDCHNPAGAGGGQFCSKGGGAAGGVPTAPSNFQRAKGFYGPGGDAHPLYRQHQQGGRAATGARAQVSQDWKDAMTSAGLRTDVPGTLKTAGPIAGPGTKKVTHKMERPPAGSPSSQHGVYRGMAIHTLGGYMTPYYYADAPGFGTFHHTPSLTRLKRQINTFRDTGVTAQGQEKAKASARYQKRKARYG